MIVSTKQRVAVQPTTSSMSLPSPTSASAATSPYSNMSNSSSSSCVDEPIKPNSAAFLITAPSASDSSDQITNSDKKTIKPELVDQHETTSMKKQLVAKPVDDESATTTKTSDQSTVSVVYNYWKNFDIRQLQVGFFFAVRSSQCCVV